MKSPNERDSAQPEYDIHEAESRMSLLVERAADGEEIIITKAGRPMAKLVPFDVPAEPRRPGLWKGKVTIASDFDAPIPGVEELFEG